jgi:nucleoside-diphosphate-sugar epimerase
MRILVTGAGGFLGGALARRLATFDEAETHVCGRSQAPPFANAHVADLRERQATEALLRRVQPDIVVHAAGRTPGKPGPLLADNGVATANLAQALGAAAPRARLLLLGSAAQYGLSQDRVPWRETDLCAPFEAYGVSKHAGETCAFAEARRSGFAVTALRLFNVISPEPRGEQVFASFLRKAAAAASAPPPWRVPMGPLMALRDFVDVEDVLEAICRVIDREVWGEVINVCTGEGRTARALLGATATQTHGAVIVDEAAPSDPLQLQWSVGNPSRCEALLGLRPSSDRAPISQRAAAWLMARAKEAADARSDA